MTETTEYEAHLVFITTYRPDFPGHNSQIPHCRHSQPRIADLLNLNLWTNAMQKKKQEQAEKNVSQHTVSQQLQKTARRALEKLQYQTDN